MSAPLRLVRPRSRKPVTSGQPGRYGHRDANGLRAAEICDLEWSQVEFGRSASGQGELGFRPGAHSLHGIHIRFRCRFLALPRGVWWG
jgi:hypothetical protein